MEKHNVCIQYVVFCNFDTCETQCQLQVNDVCLQEYHELTYASKRTECPPLMP